MAESLNAAFFVFKQRDRAVLLPATILYLVLMAVLIVAFGALNWGAIQGFGDFFTAATMNQQPSEEESFAFIGAFFGLFGWAFVFSFPMYIITAAYEAACLRWMIRGEAPGLFGLTINNDVWRVWGVYWCWLGAQMAVSTAMSMLMMPLMFMTMGDIMANPTPEQMQHWQLTVQLPVTFLQYIPLIFIGVRFGPAAATSVLRNRFSFFDAWTVTRGRFWALFGAFAIWAVLFGVLFAGLLGGAVYAQFGGDWQQYWHVAPTEEEARAAVEHMFSPAALTVMAAAFAGYLLLMLLWAIVAFGINARAALAAQEEGKIAYVPDAA